MHSVLFLIDHFYDNINRKKTNKFTKLDYHFNNSVYVGSIILYFQGFSLSLKSFLFKKIH